MDISCRSHN